MTSSIASTLAPLFAELETERALSDAIRDKAKELDRCYRALSSLLNSVHSTKGDQLPLLVQQAIPLLQEARIRISELGMLVPEGGYYRFCDDYAFPLRGLVSSIALIVLLSMGALATKAEVEKVLGINSSSTRVQLSTEDYLHGTINMINDLPRLAVNSVTLGDFRTPLRLAKVTKEIHAAFQLLNLKNDSLRKRFDGIKVSSLPPPSFSLSIFLFKSISTNELLLRACSMM